jgi:hypothetical protein
MLLNMLLSVRPDAGGAALLVALGVAAIVLLVLVVIGEGVILWLLKWGAFWRSQLASLLANIASLIVGGFMLALGIDSMPLFLGIAFVLTLLVEGGVLLLLKRGATAENWRAALIVNVVSYAVILIPGLWLTFSS